MQGNLLLGVQINNDAASSFLVWLTDAKLRQSAKKLAAADTSPGQSFPESEKKVAAENLDINDEDDSKCPHNLRASRANIPHLDKSTRMGDDNSNASQKIKLKVSI